MSVTKVTRATDRERAKTTVGNLAIGSKGIYDTRYEVVDYVPDMLATAYYVDSKVGPPAIDDLKIVIAAGSSIPHTVDMSSYAGIYGQYPIVQCVASNTVWYDMQPTFVFTGSTLTGISIYGHADGSGNFDVDTTVVIKGSN